MRKFLLLTVIIFSLKNILAQAPEIEWQNTIGGNGTDYFSSMSQTADKGFILGGSSDSDISSDKTEARIGFWDYWIVKIDSIGNVEWDKTIGGTEYDYLTKINPTNDGGYIAGGYSNSPVSGNKTEDSWTGGTYGYDYWLIKLDSFGNIEWQNTIGGNGDDYLQDIKQSPDGSYLAGGFSYSGISGDKTESNMGDMDFWLVQIDSVGNIEWQNTIGGDMIDQMYAIEHPIEGNRFLIGQSNSNISFDKTEPSIIGPSGFNTNDYWVVNLNSEDSILWQKVIGGNDLDFMYNFTKTTDGEYLVGGISYSGISGDKTDPNIGSLDFWILILNNEREILWQKTIGTSAAEELPITFETFDGGYFLGGITTAGISGDKTEINYGGEDWWILKLDSIGDIIWQNTFIGNSSDRLLECFQTEDGGYILGGYSKSDSSADKSEGSLGVLSFDYWIVKLYPDIICTPITYYEDYDGDGFGNSDFSVLSCDTPSAFVLDNTDCNDLNAAINPLSPETCNDIDDNCNGEIDDAIPYYHFYYDADNDGFGDAENDSLTCLSLITGYVLDSTDCNDLNNKIHEPVIYYADADGDYFGDSLNIISVCSFLPPEGYVENSLDCDDNNPLINPFSNEIFDSLDNNCNELIDEGLVKIETLNETEFEIYPNPNNGVFFITLNNVTNKKIIINIYNAFGKKIYYKDLIYMNTIEIKLPENIAGAICLNLQSDDIQETFIIHIVK